MLIVKQGRIKYHLWVFGMTRPGIEPRSFGQLVSTLLTIPMDQQMYISNFPLYVSLSFSLKIIKYMRKEDKNIPSS